MPRPHAVPARRRASDKNGFYGEKPLDFRDFALICHEKNHVILGLDGHVVVCHQHFVAAHDGTDGGRFRQLDGADLAPDDARSARIAVGDNFNSFGRALPERMHAHHVTLADQRQQRTDSDLLRADGDVDAVGFDQVDVGGAVDQRDDLVRAHPLGQHRRKDVGLVVVGQRAVDVHLVDAFLAQQILVGAVADQDDGRVYALGDAFGALGVAFDDLDVQVALQPPGKRRADVAAAGQQRPAGGPGGAAEGRHDIADFLGGRQKEHHIVDFDDGVAFGNDGLVTPDYGRHPGIDAAGQLVGQALERAPDQLAFAYCAGGDQLGPAVGEIQHLQRARVFDQALYVVGDQLLRADQEIDRRVLAREQLGMCQVVGGADAGELGRRVEQRVGDLTGDHVGFVGIGQRDQQFGVLDAGADQRFRARGMPQYRADVEFFLQLAQPLWVGVDDRNVVFLARQ